MISMPPELQALVKESGVKSCKELEKMLRDGGKPQHLKQEVLLNSVPESREQDDPRTEQSLGSDSVQDREDTSVLIPLDPQPTQSSDSVRGKDVKMPQEDANTDAVTPFTHVLERRDLAAHTDLQSLSSSNEDQVPPYQGGASCVDKTEDRQLWLSTLRPVEPVDRLTGQAQFVCSECKKSFLYRSQFIIHQRSHTGERPFECSVCNKGFVESSGLRVHQRIHRGEKPYECSICSKRFAHKSTLRGHTKTHTNEKPYECKHCGRCFSHKGNLNIHLRIHSDSRPYSCKECDKAVRQQGTLKQHMKIHSRMASLGSDVPSYTAGIE
ncbi:zinc finger and SCAN domain-containing protein 5B-like [Peromyscus eremicus]|uniref:zinc finger and SCAN domain-containing protein 5B-like n=1 Tax=Peromyscus eremicus TaxID=42410 RepID=UPI0027DE6BFF|nr:zinc finger and SCAN domain-containing protein 5B-like [Peromyscus eremicus]